MTAAAVRLRRLFFALWPDEFTRAALHRATRGTVARARETGGQPVLPENFHLTLAFLGNVPDERVDTIIAAARALQAPPFTLTLDRYGWFEVPQVLWIGPGVIPKPVEQLAGEIWHLMAEVAELRTDPRPLHAHVSLARKVKSAPDLAPPRPVVWPVNGFALVESAGEPDGVRYRVLASFPARNA